MIMKMNMMRMLMQSRGVTEHNRVTSHEQDYENEHVVKSLGKLCICIYFFFFDFFLINHPVPD